jgi:hypothetical protein
VAWKPDYISATDVAAYLRVDDTVDNVEFGIWATASSRAFVKRTNRQFGQLAAPAARTYRRTPYLDRVSGLWVLEIDDVQDVTGLLVNGVAYASSGAVLLPDNAPADGEPWQRLGFVTWPFPSFPGQPQTNVVTARWGWTAIPSQVIAAAKLQCSRWNSRRDSPFGIAGSPESGSEMRLLARLDPDVATTLLGLSRRRRVG